MTTEISEGIARFLGIDTSGKLSQETIFEHYRTYQDAIKQLEEKLKALKRKGANLSKTDILPR